MNTWLDVLGMAVGLIYILCLLSWVLIGVSWVQRFFGKRGWGPLLSKVWGWESLLPKEHWSLPPKAQGPLLPNIVTVFKNNRDVFMNAVLVKIRDSELFENSENLDTHYTLNTLQLEEVLIVLRAWQLISAGNFIREMGYVSHKTDDFWGTLCVAVLKEKGKTTVQRLEAHVAHMERYLRAPNEATLIPMVIEDLVSEMIRGTESLSKNSLDEMKKIVSSVLWAELEYRCSRIAYFFGDYETSAKIEAQWKPNGMPYGARRNE